MPTLQSLNTNKKKLLTAAADPSDDTTWQLMYQRLVEYRETYGNCVIEEVSVGVTDMTYEPGAVMARVRAKLSAVVAAVRGTVAREFTENVDDLRVKPGLLLSAQTPFLGFGTGRKITGLRQRRGEDTGDHGGRSHPAETKHLHSFGSGMAKPGVMSQSS